MGQLCGFIGLGLDTVQRYSFSGVEEYKDQAHYTASHMRWMQKILLPKPHGTVYP